MVTFFCLGHSYMWRVGGTCYCCLVPKLCPTLCDPVDCSLPGSSVRGISQARILEWVAILFSRGSSLPRDQTQVSCIAGRFFTIWDTKEASSSRCHREIQVIGLLYLQKSRVTLHTKINFKASRRLGDLSLVFLLCTEALWILPSWAVSSLQWSSSSGFLHSQSVFSCPIL